MASSRLSFAAQSGDLRLPDAGRILVIGAGQDTDLSGFPPERVEILQTFKPEFDALNARGFQCLDIPSGEYNAAVVIVPRAKALAQAWLALACDHVPSGEIFIDGQKTDGIDTYLKAVRARTPVLSTVSKAHGKLFSFASTPAFQDWRSETRTLPQGFTTAPGVFSADGVDPASLALAEALPEKLGKRVADLGAGWGYLSARILERDSVQELHLFEADRDALECAKLNVADPRAVFHWADATDLSPHDTFDTVVMNPPFHTSRKADPSLGIAFVRSAARLLGPRGTLWMVANRHLPYETTLAAAFRSVEEISGDRRFKLFRAELPSRTRT